MSIALTCLTWPALITVIVLWLTKSPQHRHRRRSLVLLSCGVWLLSAGMLLVSFLRGNSIINAVRSGDVGRVRQLLAGQPSLVRAKTLSGEAPLHLAAETGNAQMAALLIHSGADVDSKDSSKITPLHLAAAAGNVSIAEVLLEAGADVNAIGYRHSETPLHVAAFHGQASMVKLLLAKGANPKATDMLGRTPLQLAQENHHTNIVFLLSTPAARQPD